MLSGESGSGKSWLYWHVAENEGWKIFSANCANASRKDSLTETIASAIFKAGDHELVEYTQKTTAKAELMGLGGGAEAQRRYNIVEKELLLRAFESARKQAGDSPTVVVVDNLEAIFNSSKLMAELANIILLLDDPEYAQHRIKLLIVGVPAEVVEYYQNVQNLESVANRLQEAPTVMSLTRAQIGEFIKRGFSEQLKVIISEIDLKELGDHIENVTLGIAQRLHEYCELLGYRIQDNGWKYDQRLLKEADHRYVVDCLKKSYSIIESFMNEKATKTGRRNQVLYSLGLVSRTTFDSAQIEQIIRAQFPKTTANITLAVNQTLADLCIENGSSALLRKMPKGNSYRFTDPRCLMCIRLMLAKDAETEKVSKKAFRR